MVPKPLRVLGWAGLGCNQSSRSMLMLEQNRVVLVAERLGCGVGGISQSMPRVNAPIRYHEIVALYPQPMFCTSSLAQHPAPVASEYLQRCRHTDISPPPS